MLSNPNQTILRFKGSSDISRLEMGRALREGSRIHWTPGANCSDLAVSQLSPLSRLRGSEVTLSPCVTVVVPTQHPNPPFVEAFTAQIGVEKVLLISNGNGPQRHPDAEILQTPWLGHGATRLLALEHIKTEYVFFSVDDALPMNNMIAPLIEALAISCVDAASPRQIPWPDADEFSRLRLSRWTPDAPAPYEIPHADHVGTLYRTADLRRWRLHPAPIAEDAWWTMDKHTICVPSSTIMHAHKRQPLQLYRRERSIGLEMRKMSRGGKPLSRVDVVFSLFSGTYRYGLREGMCSLAENWGRRHGAMGR